MKRYAAHYIFLAEGRIYKQYYIELNANDCIEGIYPLEDEIEGTVFHNGILFPVSKENALSNNEMLNKLKNLQRKNPSDSVFELLDKSGVICTHRETSVSIYQLDGIDLLAAKLCTDDGRCNGHIQRL